MIFAFFPRGFSRKKVSLLGCQFICRVGLHRTTQQPIRNFKMFKFVFSAIMLIALSCPTISAAQDCGCCDPAPVCAPKPRKKLALVDVSREVCRLKSTCVTDECGCTKSKLVAVKECVTRKKLALVDADPCEKNCFQKLREKLAECRAARNACKPEPCCAPAPEPCCEPTPAPAPAPCCEPTLAPAPCCG